MLLGFRLIWSFSVRYLPGDQDAVAASFTNQPTFGIHHAPNIFLETIKRGEYDDLEASESDSESTTTVVARLYEAFGGHAQATVVIGGQFSGRVIKAATTNLLEEEDEEVQIMDGSADGFGASSVVKLDFRGFEVKTLKVTLKGKGTSHSQTQPQPQVTKRV